MAKITMYSTQWCPFCKRAEQFLQLKGYSEIDKISIDEQPEMREEMIDRSGRRSVPQIFLNDIHVEGYDDLVQLEREGKLDALLSN